MVEKLAPTSRLIYSHTGLRGVAAMSVFLAHILIYKGLDWELNTGIFRVFLWHDSAVNLFFALSGFILNWVYFTNSETINWKSYFVARAGRILPLYYLTTLIFLAYPFALIMIHGWQVVSADFLYRITTNLFLFSGIINGYYDTINQPAWSISVEMFCYVIVFPILVWSNKYLKRNRFSFVASLIFVGIFTRALVLCYRMHPIHLFHTEWNSCFLARGVFGFTLGFFVCSLFQHNNGRNPRIWIFNLTLIIPLIAFILVQFYGKAGQFFIYTFPILIYFTAFDKGASAWILKRNIFQWMGERSYSLYLWHIPLILFYSWITDPLWQKNPQYSIRGIVNCAFIIPLVLTVSEISYRYFETPCRKFIRDYALNSSSSQA